jgi:hypothetical protein
MDDKDRFDPQNSDPEDDVETWPEGLLANHSTGAGAGSSSAGSLAGGVVGAAQAGRIMEAQETEEDITVRVPARPDVYATKHRVTGDEGVSAPQREVEADELNG